MDWVFLPAAAVLEPTNWILIPAALVFAFLVITLAFRILRAAIGTIVTLAILLVALQLVFGITPDDLWQELLTLSQTLIRSAGLQS